VKGKFAYMSPEQVQGDQLDARADVFAMGIVLYRITTGQHPFKSDNPAATIRNILTRGPYLPSDLVSGYPKGLEGVVMKALARDRDKRFDSANEMMLALQQSLPASLSANSEKNTEIFLNRLFAKRIAERSEALQASLIAAEAGDRSAGQSAGKDLRSQSTMRAVSVETGEARAFTPARAPIIVTLAPKRSRRPLAAVAFAACVAAAIGATALRKHTLPTAGSANGAPPAAPSVTAAPIAGPEAPTRIDETTPSPSGESTATAVPAPEVASPKVAPAPTTRKRTTRRTESSTTDVSPTPSQPTSTTPTTAPPLDGPVPEVDPLNRRK
jgi:serine/threonine-protein kinase